DRAPERATKGLQRSMNEARRILVSGLVQGVGYRYFVLTRANERQIVGQVRNLQDGRVEIVVEGTAEALDRFLADLEVGSRFSKVSSVEQAREAATGRYSTFSIVS